MRTMKIENVTRRVQFVTLDAAGNRVVASVSKIGGNVYVLRTAPGTTRTHAVEVRGDHRLPVDYNTEGVAGVQVCRTHGPKIVRPSGVVQCDDCNNAYAAKCRAKAKGRTAGTLEDADTVLTRRDARARAGAARADALMARLAASGLLLSQQG